MKFDIARQPLVPAFLTLLALVVAAMWGATLCGAGVGTAESATRTAPPATVVQPGAATSETAAARGIDAPRVATRPASVQPAPTVADGLTVASPGELLGRFQHAFPGWSRLLAGLLILFAGMSTGRLTVRYNLYSVSTCLAIPLYGIVACGPAAGSDFLPAVAAATLLALTVKNFGRSCCNGYAFDALFRASFYLGLLPLIAPAALPLLLLLPLALLLFRRTLREAAVAATGLLLPALAFCYVNWGAGGAFFAPAEALATAFASGAPLALLRSMPLPELALPVAVALLDLVALLFFLSDIYAAGTKPRFILIFTFCVLALTILLLAGPAATPGAIALLAVPSAILLPVLFVRIAPAVALPLYLLLLGAAFIGTIIQ